MTSASSSCSYCNHSVDGLQLINRNYFDLERGIVMKQHHRVIIIGAGAAVLAWR